MRKKFELTSRNGALLIALLALTAAPAAAEKQWVNGQAARLVVGQPSFTRANPTSSRSAIGSAGGVAVGANRLFIADGNRIGAAPINNRVLVYENLDGFIPDLDAELPQDTTCPVCVGLPDLVLGQPDFDTFDRRVEDGMRAPSGVATDGVRLAVADTNNNRVLIWNALPTSMNQRPDVVVGQPDFSTNLPTTTQSGMRGPQGVWLDEGKLFVADTQNGRILIWNSVPTSNGQSADVVVGQPNFDTRPEPDLTQANFEPSATNMIDPASVTTSNGRMFVADLGFERVLIWNAIPTSNGAAADVVVGQPDFTTSGFVDHDDDNSTPTLRRSVVAMCEQIGPFDDDGTITPDDGIFPPPIDRDPDDDDDGEPDAEPRLPKRCEFTLNFPRFALSDGEKLYIADSGNDRILVYNEIPQQNGAAADVVIGQRDFIALAADLGASGVRSPTALAHDGENLYVADPFSRRILVFTPAEPMIVTEGVRNGASFAVLANGWLEWEGSTQEDQLVTVEVARREYEFRTEAGDTAADVRDKVVELLNDDPDGAVTASPFNGAGIFAKGRIKFGGSVRPADRIVLTIGDQTYEYVTQGQAEDPGPFILVDRFNFIIDQAGHPDVTVDRDVADVDTLQITAQEAGPAFNGIPFSIQIPAGSPLTVEVSGSALEGGSFPRRARLVARRSVVSEFGREVFFEGRPGNGIEISTQIGGAGITTRASGGRLTGGSDARMLTQGAIVAIFGQDLAPAPVGGEFFNGRLPFELGGSQVYVNGRLAPILGVSPNQINVIIPWEVEGEGSSLYVRREMADGSIMTSIARGNPIVRAAPGIFACTSCAEPRPAVALHGQGAARGQVAVQPATNNQIATSDNPTAIGGGATLTITVNGRPYNLQTVEGDTTNAVRDRFVELINNADDPDVTAAPGEQGFFSARSTITFEGDPNEGDTVTLIINGRSYSYTAREGDTATVVRNVLVDRINAGRGDPETTARRLIVLGAIQMQVIARSLNEEGNNILFSVEVSDGAAITVVKDTEGDTLAGGNTPPVVILVARRDGREGNDITYEASSSDPSLGTVIARDDTLCCGNIPFSLITQENPAVPGESIIIYATGLGFPAVPEGASLPPTGAPAPASPLFEGTAVADDFVSSLAGGRTAQIEFVGLAPGFAGVWQINLKLNELLPDDPSMPLDIAQVLFISNRATIPIRNLKPIDGDQF